MKTTILSFLLIIFQGVLVNAQIEPQYKSYFYFEDSAGNKDTVYIGHDDNIPKDENGVLIDTEYGEIMDTTPFNAIFEVRAGRNVDGIRRFGDRRYRLFNPMMVKANYETFGCLWPETAFFFIHTKSYPIKITWDIQFDSPCMTGSFFTPDYLYSLINPMDWITFDWIRFCCVPKAKEYIIDLPNSPKDNGVYNEQTFFVLRPIEGSTNEVDTIWGIQLVHGPHDGYSPCILIVSSDDERGQVRVSPYPVPAIDRISFNFLDLNGTFTIKIYDPSGKLYTSSIIHAPDIHHIDIHTYNQGMYIYEVLRDNKRIQTGKLLKI